MVPLDGLRVGSVMVGRAVKTPGDHSKLLAAREESKGFT